MTPDTLTAEESAAADALIRLALAEDLGTVGDRTSLATIPESTHGRAAFVARAEGVVAGLPVAERVCAAVGGDLTFSRELLEFLDRLDIPRPPVRGGLAFEQHVTDGTTTHPGMVLATVSGPLRAILAAERTALNFLQRLSGIASLTRKFVEAAAGFRAKLLDTRKTTPGWRLLEKYAVRAGGGTNHRFGLHDGILIKDNHLAGLDGNIERAVEAARAYPGNAQLPVEVEVDTLDQLDHALAVKADIVLLDNMTLDQLRVAVERRDAATPGTLLEASGGVNLTTIHEIAATGVDRISVGALTHSAPALDIGLDYRDNEAPAHPSSDTGM
jgi:nicotinate-nucleotide pyrophosphorylase (carboxylating)